MRPIDDESVSAGTGPLKLDCEFARRLGWTNEDCTEIAAAIHALVLGKSHQVALRGRVRLRICQFCECMVPLDGCDLGCAP